MPRHIEQLNGGLVTVRDPAVLAMGEMSLMQNAIYHAAIQAPQRAAGRASFGAVSATATPVRGLRDLQFDNGDHFLLAMQGATLSSATVGDTGTFASCTSYTTTATAMDAVHFNDEWFLFGGAISDVTSATASNLVAYTVGVATGQTLSFRTHGLVPNTNQVATATGAGTWTAGATGYFEYWYTEVFEYLHNNVTSRIEGTFTGTPTTLFVNSTAMQASISVQGGPTASTANKWVLYRAGPKTLATDILFPTGFKLAEGQFGTTATILDGSATTGAYAAANATSSAGMAGYTAFFTPGNIFASDNAYATAVASAGLNRAIVASFPTFSITEPVVGITVSIEAKSTSSLGGRYAVQVSNDGGTTWSSDKVWGPPTTTDTVFESGGTSDLWGLNWTNNELSTGKFLVRVILTSSLLTTPNVSIDQIRAKITANGSVALDESTPFPAIVISAASVDAAVGSHGHPPRATTGDVFQGCLVTNSLVTDKVGRQSERSFIRFSLPSQPDYFPEPYYLDFQVGDNDAISNIKTLNNHLGVFSHNRTFRVNYLPSEADADFNRGICKEEVSSQYGCVNEMCACVFEGQGGRTELAFISNQNLHATNLFTVRMLADDLEWRGVIATASSTPIALINNRENEELLFYYKNATSGQEHYKCLHFSYNERHMRPGGRLKISGPVNMRNNVGGSGGTFADLYSAWIVQRTSGEYQTFLGYGGDSAGTTAASAGHVFREQGTAIPALDSTMKLRTRSMYLSQGGVGSEFRLDRLFCYVASANTAQSIQVTPYVTRTNATAGVVSASAQTRAWAGEKMFALDFARDAEGLELEIAQVSNNAGHFAPQMLTMDWTDLGIEDSGK